LLPKKTKDLASGVWNRISKIPASDSVQILSFFARAFLWISQCYSTQFDL
jgi:hypothetical protein